MKLAIRDPQSEIPDPDITEAEVAAMAASDRKQAPRMTPEDAHAYNEYLKDWQWRMKTHLAVQKQYIGPTRWRDIGQF